MARSLSFATQSEQFDCEFEKVDRKKLYGWIDKKAFDKEGNECYFGSISSDGMHMFGRGSFEQGYIDSQGQWLESEQLKIVDADGQELEKRESSFNAPILLTDTVPIDTYLMHIAKSVYHLNASETLIKLVAEQEEIYCFPFNYYSSHSPDPAFLIASQGELFMIVGQPCGFEFIEMPAVEPLLIEDDDEEDEEDDIDFSMF